MTNTTEQERNAIIDAGLEAELLDIYDIEGSGYFANIEKLELFTQLIRERLVSEHGEAIRPVAAVLVKVSGVGSTHMTPAIDYYTKPPQPQSVKDALEKVKALLAGIDKEESESDIGWWETSTGADFGKSILNQVNALITDTQEKG